MTGTCAGWTAVRERKPSVDQRPRRGAESVEVAEVGRRRARPGASSPAAAASTTTWSRIASTAVAGPPVHPQVGQQVDLADARPSQVRVPRHRRDLAQAGGVLDQAHARGGRHRAPAANHCSSRSSPARTAGLASTIPSRAGRPRAAARSAAEHLPVDRAPSAAGRRSCVGEPAPDHVARLRLGVAAATASSRSTTTRVGARPRGLVDQVGAGRRGRRGTTAAARSASRGGHAAPRRRLGDLLGRRDDERRVRRAS